MAQLLKIDASSRSTGSHSRELADAFLAEWRKTNPAGRVVTRDLIATPIPHITGVTVEAFYTPEAQRDARLTQALALSDQLIAELMQSDTILVSSPVYNFSVPSALKAWIDHVSRIGVTFAFDGTSFEGLVKGKRVYFALAYGLPATPEMDMLRPYLQMLFSFLGMTETNFITVEGTVTEAVAHAKSTAARRAIEAAQAA